MKYKYYAYISEKSQKFVDPITLSKDQPHNSFKQYLTSLANYKR